MTGRRQTLCAVLLLLVLPVTVPSLAATDAEVARQVSFAPKPGARVPLELAFSAAGGVAPLAELIKGETILLTFAWFDCANLCGLVLNSLADGLGRLEPVERQALQVIVVSMDPQATRTVAAEAAENLAGRYPVAGVDDRWLFLTGSGEAIGRLAAATGFNFVYDGDKQQFAHPAGVVALDRTGRVRGAVAGVNFGAGDLRGLQATSRGQSRASINPVLLLCYDYDPGTGQYSLTIVKLLRLVAVLFIGAGGWFYWRWYRRQGVE